MSEETCIPMGRKKKRRRREERRVSFSVLESYFFQNSLLATLDVVTFF